MIGGNSHTLRTVKTAWVGTNAWMASAQTREFLQKVKWQNTLEFQHSDQQY